jgi:hypothetical protein
MKCALVGDFNAKTAVLEKVSEPNETFLNVMYVMTTKFYLKNLTVGHNAHQNTMGHNLEHQNS